MCPSMGEDVETYTPKPKKPTENREKNPNKHFNQFLYKAILVAIFLVIVPLLPSQTPENPQYSRSWELLQLIFVGIVVSYGLFSKRNDDAANKEHHGSTTLDNAQSYVARLLQVSSVFDDDSDNMTAASVVSEDNSKIQAWNSQYHREEPPVLQERNEKPLLLPVRSLKSRVSEPEMVMENPVKNPGPGKMVSSNSGKSRNGDFPGSDKLFASNSGKSRNGDFPGLNSLDIDKNLDQANVVLRSPIPWRSRSGRMVIREQDDQDDMISMENSELRKLESPRSVRTQPSSSSKRLSPTHSFSSESSSSSSRSSEETVRKNFYVKSSSPPAPPPPPPPPSFHRKSGLEKSNSSLVFHPPQEKDLKRSVKSVPSEFIVDSNSGPELNRARAQSVRTIVPKFRRLTSTELQMETEAEKKKEDQYLEKVLVETDGDSSEPDQPEEDDYFEESVGSNEVAVVDEGPDVDKKADEFIAKFREQIRLQRIESIRRTTDQIARKQAR